MTTMPICDGVSLAEGQGRHGDFKRDPDWTAPTCETAAAFTAALLRTQPIAPIARP